MLANLLLYSLQGQIVSYICTSAFDSHVT